MRRNVKNKRMKIERYPICLTCFEVTEEEDKAIPGFYYCRTCGLSKGPVEVWGKDRIAELIHAIAKNNNLQPV